MSVVYDLDCGGNDLLAVVGHTWQSCFDLFEVSSIVHNV